MGWSMGWKAGLVMAYNDFLNKLTKEHYHELVEDTISDTTQSKVIKRVS